MKQNKTLQFTIPEHLTIEQYDKISQIQSDDKLEKVIGVIQTLTGYDKEEIQTWSITSIKEVYNHYRQLFEDTKEFHSIIEWNGTLYGYSDIKKMNFGCYIDLESLCKDLNNNLHKVAAILYRPITKHKFDSLSFMYKQKVKMLNNKVENVFDWYEIEKYDSKERVLVEDNFKDFPAFIILGALGFFLSTASLYLNSIASSEKLLTTTMKNKLNNQTIKSLLENITAGGGLFTDYLKPIYLQLQETKPSRILTL
jgi:hypothetical protein